MIFKKILNVIGWVSFGVWSLLTIIVIIFLQQRYAHPHIKGISNVDLLYYRNFSIGFISIFILSRIVNRKKSA
jgi:hypothetical protein